jgi:sugar lactone lactonase YvrE
MSVAVILGVGVIAGLANDGPGASSAAATTAVTPTIWVVNQGSSTLLSYPLSATGDAAPAVTISANASSLYDPFGTEAFDVSGNLWIANLNSNTLVKYTPGQLAATGDPTPAVTISANAASLHAPGSVAFDASGNLWALNESGDTLVEYTPSQLASSGDPVPAVTISSDGTSLTNPYGFAFDTSGDLWVSNNEDPGTVVEYTPSQLATSGNPTPAVTISANASFSLDGSSGVALDASGDLWVTNTGNDTLVDYTPNQLVASGDPTPAVTISANASSIDGPYSLAFDAAGDLWVPNYSTDAIVEFTPSQLTTSGDPTPSNTISGGSTGMTGPGGVAIEQAPTVTSVSPTSGPAAGGTAVTIHGTGFLFGATVDFGSVAAASVTYQNFNELTAVAPAGAATVDVTVSTFAGTSTTSAADKFTYGASGYTLAAADGGIFNFNTPFYGSEGGKPLNAPVVGLAADTASGGYWLVAKDGGIFNFNAPFYGSEGGKPLNAPVVGMAADTATGGYWEVASDGGVFNFNAPFYGSQGGKPLNAPIVGIAAAPNGTGYWLVAKDGGIFSFGPGAAFYGSQGGKPLNAPVVGIAADTVTGGYWEVASDGGIFAFNAPFYGSQGGKPLNKPVVGIANAPGATGYWEVASDGGVFAFNVPFAGSMGGKPLNAPIVGLAGG